MTEKSAPSQNPSLPQAPDEGRNGQDEILPPAYSAEPSRSTSPGQTINPPSRGRTRYDLTPGMPPVDFSAYQIPYATVSKDKTTITIAQTSLVSNHTELCDFITRQAALPPKPEVRITGTHYQNGVTKEIDFDIRINMMRHIVRPRSSRWNYLKISGPPPTSGGEGSSAGGSSRGTANKLPSGGGIAEWTKQFCKDQATNKAFILDREVTNWNTQLLDVRIRTLLAKLRYQGHITVTFPLTHSRVIVTVPLSSKTMFTRFVSLFQDAKRYEGIRSVWPYANIAGTEDGNDTGRECVLQSESEWWNDWSGLIARAVLAKRQGLLTVDDLMELAMSPGEQLKAPAKDWGMSQ